MTDIKKELVCKPDEHKFETIHCYEAGDVAGYVAIEWCTKCGVIHENTHDEDIQFRRPYKSHVPSGETTGEG